MRRCPSQASDGASAAHWGDAARRPRRPSHPHACTTFHALTDRALVAAVAWKYIAYNPTSNIKPSKRHGLASTPCAQMSFSSGPMLAKSSISKASADTVVIAIPIHEQVELEEVDTDELDNVFDGWMTTTST